MSKEMQEQIRKEIMKEAPEQTLDVFQFEMDETAAQIYLKQKPDLPFVIHKSARKGDSYAFSFLYEGDFFSRLISKQAWPTEIKRLMVCRVTGENQFPVHLLFCYTSKHLTRFKHKSTPLKKAIREKLQNEIMALIPDLSPDAFQFDFYPEQASDYLKKNTEIPFVICNDEWDNFSILYRDEQDDECRVIFAFLNTRFRTSSMRHNRLLTSLINSIWSQFKEKNGIELPTTQAAPAKAPESKPTVKENQPKEIFKLIRAIKTMTQYGEDLSHEYIAKGNHVQSLANQLNTQLNTFLADAAKKKPSLADVKQFKQNFINLAHSKDQLMHEHRRIWKPIVENIIIAFTGIGFLALLAKMVFHAVDSHINKKQFSFNNCFFDAKTQSQKLCEAVEQSVEDISFKTL